MHSVFFVFTVRFLNMEIWIGRFGRYNWLGRSILELASMHIVLYDSWPIILHVVAQLNWVLAALFKYFIWCVQNLPIAQIGILRLQVAVGADMQITAVVLAIQFLVSFWVTHSHCQRSLWLLLKALPRDAGVE